jgi:hypothetical protein
MYFPAPFTPTPSKFAFEPQTLTFLPNSSHKYAYLLNGYWWSGTPKKRVLHFGEFKFSFESVDPKRIQNYQYANYATVLKVAQDVGKFNGNYYEYDYNIEQEELARYNGTKITVAPGFSNTKALTSFYDSLASNKPQAVPIGADGWYAQGLCAQGYNEVEFNGMIH